MVYTMNSCRQPEKNILTKSSNGLRPRATIDLRLEHMKTKPELVKKSFTVAGITNALNGAEDHLSHNHEYLQSIMSEEDENNSADVRGL